MDVRPNVVGHGLLAPFVDRADGIDDLVGFDVSGWTGAAQRGGDVAQRLLHLLRRWFPGAPQAADVALEEIGDGSGSGITYDLDAEAGLDHPGVVAGADLQVLAKRHRRQGADLLPPSHYIEPLLAPH